MHQVKRNKRLICLITLLIILCTLPFIIYFIQQTQQTQQHAAGGNVQVDFNTPLVSLDPNAFSGTISTYGSGGGSINDNAKQRTMLGNLGLGFYRIPLQWNGGNIVSSAGGHPSGSGDTWISNIRSFGGIPMIVLGGSTDNNFSPQDGANMVSHFSGTNKVEYWVIGNEPGNGGMSIGTYCTLFNQTVAAMKAVDPTIKVAGPAWAYFDANTIQQFLNCAGSNVDIIDYHHYGMGSSFLDNATALSQTINWENEVNQTRQMINNTVPARASQIGIQVGEYNWSWRTADGYQGWNGDDRFYQSVVTVWAASVAGHIAKAGGRGHQYADQNGALGITFEDSTTASHYGQTVDDPMPIYHGLRMFSGGNLFRKFGTQMVQATTTLPNVEVFASTNQKNIVMINKDPNLTQTASFQLAGFSNGTVDVWQTNTNAPFAPPVKTVSLTIGTSFDYPLPPYSVTTFVITDGIVNATPTPTPSNTPSFTPIPTNISTLTPAPTNTPAPTYTPVPSSAYVSLVLKLHGLGNGGDNANPGGTGNLSPLHPQRTVSVTLFNTANQQVATPISGTLSYDSLNTKLFIGTVSLQNTIPSGIYSMAVSSPGFLNTTVHGVVALTLGQTTSVPAFSLVTGDINGDNSLSLLDYNALLNCYAQAGIGSCLSSDINDDGIVDLKDINLLLREFSTQSGS